MGGLPERLTKMFGLMDDFDPWFNIVTPSGPFLFEVVANLRAKVKPKQENRIAA